MAGTTLHAHPCNDLLTKFGIVEKESSVVAFLRYFLRTAEVQVHRIHNTLNVSCSSHLSNREQAHGVISCGELNGWCGSGLSCTGSAAYRTCQEGDAQAAGWLDSFRLGWQWQSARVNPNMQYVPNGADSSYLTHFFVIRPCHTTVQFKVTDLALQQHYYLEFAVFVFISTATKVPEISPQPLGAISST